MSNHRRDSDRWITPRVIAWGLFLATVLILAVIAAVTYLTARGLDPDPMVSLVGNVATAIGAVGAFVLQLVGRRTVTKIERNTGTLAPKVEDLGAKVDQALWVDEDRTRMTLPPVPPLVRETKRHPFGDP